MDLGEKLTTISDRIYDAAVQEFTETGVSVTMAALIMDDVSGRFAKAAYRAVNAIRAAEELEAARRAAEELEKETARENQEEKEVKDGADLS